MKNFEKIEKNLKKKLKKKSKKFAKILQNAQKKIFPLCKIFAKFLQILNLHIDFRPCEESVSNICQKFGYLIRYLYTRLCM